VPKTIDFGQWQSHPNENFFSQPNVVQCGTFIQAVNSRRFAYLVLTVCTVLAVCIKTPSNKVFMESIAKDI
jgi:hypothetical protein